MKKLIIVLSVAATAAITGCSKDDLTSPKALQNKNTTVATTDVGATDQRLINSGSVLVPAPNQGYVKVFLFGAAKLSADHPETFVDINKRDVSQRAFDASFKAMYVKFNERWIYVPGVIPNYGVEGKLTYRTSSTQAVDPDTPIQILSWHRFTLTIRNLDNKPYTGRLISLSNIKVLIIPAKSDPGGQDPDFKNYEATMTHFGLPLD